MEYKCNLFTKNRYLYNESSSMEENYLIDDYEAYIDETFNPNKEDNIGGKYDEWLFKIIPQDVFKLKTEFFYIGKKYGFYVNYNEKNDEYFTYMIKTDNEANVESSNHMQMKLETLYYENYKYDEATGKVSLVYKEIVIDTHPGEKRYFVYEKYSMVKDVFLKDVSISGAIYNEHHLNDGQADYNVYNDDGAFFIGNNYVFKGRAIQAGELDVVADIAKVAIGYIPKIGDIIGTVFDAVDTIKAFDNLSIKNEMDFRDTLTNENNIGFYIDDATSKDAQIQNLGCLIKDSAVQIKTMDSNPILYGIHKGDYVSNTFIHSTTKMWDTRFVGKVTLDIVSEHNGKIELISGNVTSNEYVTQLNEYAEENILENNIPKEVNILKGGEQDFDFIADNQGYFTFRTDDENTYIHIDGAEAGEYPNECKVKLKYKQEIRIKTSFNDKYRQGQYNIKGVFTPEGIDIDEEKVFEAPARMNTYFKLNIPAAGSYNFVAGGGYTGEHEIRAYVIKVGSSQNVCNTEYSNLTKGCFIAEEGAEYYIGLVHDNDNDIIFAITLTKAETIAQGTVYEQIDQIKMYTFTSQIIGELNVISTIENHNGGFNIFKNNIILLSPSGKTFTFMIEKGVTYIFMVNGGYFNFSISYNQY